MRNAAWEALSLISDIEYDAQGLIVEAWKALIFETECQELVGIFNAYVDAVNSWNHWKNEMIDRI
jgi:hypothetical protein